MSILSRIEDQMLDKYLDNIDCTGMCGDDPCTCDELEFEDYEDSDEARWEDQERDEVEPYDRW